MRFPQAQDLGGIVLLFGLKPGILVFCLTGTQKSCTAKELAEAIE